MQLRLCYEIIITITGPPRSILLSTSGKKALDNTALSKLPFFYHSLTLHWVCNYTVQNITLSYLWNCAIFCEHTAFPFFNPFLFIQWTLALLHSRSPVEQYSGWCHYPIKTEKLLVFFVCFPLHVSDRHLCTHTSVLENQMPGALDDWNLQYVVIIQIGGLYLWRPSYARWTAKHTFHILVLSLYWMHAGSNKTKCASCKVNPNFRWDLNGTTQSYTIIVFFLNNNTRTWSNIQYTLEYEYSNGTVHIGSTLKKLNVAACSI